MKDGPLRRAVKWVARCCFAVDLAATRAIRRARGDKPHYLGGQCGLCAKCCESPVIQTGVLVQRLPTVRRVFLWWHRVVNGFELAGQYPRERAFVFRCTHFDWETRRCDSYSSRPGMCRDYPRVLLWDDDPAFLPGCGYRAVSPRAQHVAAMIDAEDLPEETKRRLKQRLHAEGETGAGGPGDAQG